MKILWITMTVPPEADAQLGGEKVLKKTGGWVLGLAHYLTHISGIELAIASPSDYVRTLRVVEGERIRYYVVPASRSSKELQVWREVKKDYAPDIVHIHGSEHHSALAWIEANGTENTVLSLQGIISVIAHYYNEGLSTGDIIRNITPRDLYRGTLFHEAHDYAKRGKEELQVLKNIHHVIGRTEWDKTQIWAINPTAKYHFCNEILRPEFYSGETWSYQSCHHHTLFISQSIVPYKGLHQVIKALPIILREYPDVQVRVAGYNMLRTTLKERIKRIGYAKYIKALANDAKVSDRITFTGRLSAEEMKAEYLRTNVFVSPSAIENSPNSLCEAQMLGVPCVASRVGGVETLIPNSACGIMYEYNDIAGLAKAICETFRNAENFSSIEEQCTARMRHDVETNCKQMIAIYQEVMSQK